ncbi:uncharacterized protein [Nothobranchius furzeri]|uniref:Transcript variant X1 n=1 Tax=Nothobranchius furzeri TaxID=105023 RepID=A0A9D2XNQ9_NOTFU|nr:transcript variant X1 [Nothobranchius furzeri]
MEDPLGSGPQLVQESYDTEPIDVDVWDEQQKQSLAAEIPTLRPLNSCPSTPAPDFLLPLGLKPGPQPSFSTSDLQTWSLGSNPDRVQQDAVPGWDSPLRFHGYPIEEYQAIYHSVVDPMLRKRNGKRRKYSQKLGRQIKKRLSKRLSHPQLKVRETVGGLLLIEESKAVAKLPHLDVSDEPKVNVPNCSDTQPTAETSAAAV